MTHKQKDSWLSRLTIKGKIVIVLALLFVVASAGILIYSAFLSAQYIDSKGNTYSPQQIRKELAGKNADDRKRDIATMVYESQQAGDNQKTSVIYDQAIALETDPILKVKLAIEESQEFYHKGRYNDALNVAKKAESYSPDKYLIYSWLSQLYELGKEYNLAAKYYLLTADLAGGASNQSGFSKDYYQRKAAQMQAAIGRSG